MYARQYVHKRMIGRRSKYIKYTAVVDPLHNHSNHMAGTFQKYVSIMCIFPYRYVIVFFSGHNTVRSIQS